LIDTSLVGRGDRIRQIAAEVPDAYVASAYDDTFVIEGNATLGAELAAKDFDAVVAPIGGGGLISGIVKGMQRSRGGVEFIGAEPALGNDAARSMREGRIVFNNSEPATIADGARTISLGELNWPLIRDRVREIIEVPDETIAEAVKLLFNLANLKCEPTGALSLGAVLVNPKLFEKGRVCVVVSGGNVDPAVYRDLIS
ncbi:MAG: pyridoxal-phosphate dependent enzyme, partial [Acidobacteria bacterium]|nr:pyridoxal-phosphate dependent enzyme [Acidobacteriota bacterium]